MLHARTPISRIAVQLFMKDFQGWLTSSAELSAFEIRMIENTAELLWLDSSRAKDVKEVKRTATALFTFMDEAWSAREGEALSNRLINNANMFAPALNEASRDRAAAKGETDPDKRIKALLALYQHLYEKLSRLVLAPAILAFGLVRKPSDRKFAIESDGRAKMSALKEIEKLAHYPQDRFRIGINQHVRNAYSHHRYTMLDGGNVRLVDVDPKNGRVTWGPETWSVEQLEDLCDTLWFNCLGAVLACVLFSVNYRKFMAARGWGPTASPSFELRFGEIESTLTRVADEWSIDVNDMKLEDGVLSMNVQTRIRGIDADQEILLGGDRWAKKFVIPVHHEEHEIARQLIGLLQSNDHLFQSVDQIDILVSDPEGGALGALSIAVPYLQTLKSEGEMPFKEARKGFLRDTLGHKTMFLRIEGPAREA